MTTQSDRGLKPQACRWCRSSPSHGASMDTGFVRCLNPSCPVGPSVVCHDHDGFGGAHWALLFWDAGGLSFKEPRADTRPIPVTAEVSVDDGMVQRSIMAYYAAIADAYDSQEDDAPMMSSDIKQAIGMRAALTAALKAQKGVGEG